jgi:hypothetical protein
MIANVPENLRKHRALRPNPTISALCLLAGALLCYLVSLTGLIAGSPSVQPFYLERGLYERSSAGDLKIFSREFVARRHDGTTSVVETDELDKLPPLRKVATLDGTMIWLLDSAKVKSSYPKLVNGEARAVIERVTKPRPDCGVGVSAGVSAGGYDVVSGQKTVVGTSKLPGNRTLKFWLAPDLTCEMVRFVQSLDDSGIILTEGRLLTLTIGEPDPRLFDLGDTHLEVMPSELRSRQFRTAGLEMSAGERQALVGIDHEYLQRSPASGR